MPLEIVIGTQWGDEGKGRIVDMLSEEAQVVARYNGGDNAGHTVTVGEKTFKLHLLPSGLIHPNTTGVLGNGMVINPVSLMDEMEMLRKNGVVVDSKRVLISFAAHMITPAHRALDRAQEAARGQGQIGTTGRGIGPAYTDKAARRGIRMQDMLDIDTFREKMVAHVENANLWLTRMYNADPLDAAAVAEQYVGYARILQPYIGDVGAYLNGVLKNGGRVLAEGAQGTLLDIDLGTYPFVTSSYPTSGGVLVGLGIGIVPVGRVVGVTKAFQSRVGSGPFPTEAFGETAERLRGTGSNPWDEFGTTTGRPRRVGWLDGVLLRYAMQVNCMTELAVTKMDVLSGLPEIHICTAYRSGGHEYANLPLGPADLSPFEAVYETMPGWQGDLQSVRSWKDLPREAQQYLKRIEEICGAPVHYASVGPERTQTVVI
jgi:adenylosuccinate synthase